MGNLDYEKMLRDERAALKQARDSLHRVRTAAQNIQNMRHVPNSSLFRRYAEAFEQEADIGLGHPK